MSMAVFSQEVYETTVATGNTWAMPRYLQVIRASLGAEGYNRGQRRMSG